MQTLCHLIKNARFQSFFRAFRVFRGQYCLVHNMGYIQKRQA
jgi:hypothetical protein